MTAFRDAVFILTLLMCAAGVENMNYQAIQEMPMKQQAFFYKTMDPTDFDKGRLDCHEGKPRKQNASDAYNCGYKHQELNHD